MTTEPSDTKLPPGCEWHQNDITGSYYVTSAHGVVLGIGGSLAEAVRIAALTFPGWLEVVEKATKWDEAVAAEQGEDTELMQNARMVAQARPERLWDTWAVATAKAFIAQQPELAALRAKAERLADLESGHGQCDCHYAPCQHDLAARLQEVERDRDTARSTAGQYLAQIDKLKRELKQSEGRYHELVEALRPELKAEQAKIETESKQESR